MVKSRRKVGGSWRWDIRWEFEKNEVPLFKLVSIKKLLY